MGITTFLPTDYQSSTEAEILSFTTAPLWKYVLNEAKDDYETTCVAATDFPTDVTAEYTGTGKFGIPEDAEFGYAWRFSIRDDMM